MSIAEDTRPDHQIAKEELTTFVAALPIKCQITDAAGCVSEFNTDKKRLVSLKYAVVINGHLFDYNMGIGHIPWDRVDVKNTRIKGGQYFTNLSEADWCFFNTHKIHPHATFMDLEGWASACARLAKMTGTKPSVEDVLAAVARDAEALTMTFPDWAGNFGYDTDSRKAEETYNACVDNGRKLRRFLSADQINTLSELGSRL